MFGPPIGKEIICYIDDVNAAKQDVYGNQSSVELLRCELELKYIVESVSKFFVYNLDSLWIIKDGTMQIV